MIGNFPYIMALTLPLTVLREKNKKEETNGLEALKESILL